MLLCLLCLFVLYVNLALWPPALQCHLPALFFVRAQFVLFLLFVAFFVNQSRTKGEGWSTANKFRHPSNFIADRPKAALLYWLLCDFRCGVLLFFVILVLYKYRNR